MYIGCRIIPILMALFTIRTFDSPIAAHLAKTKLLSEGITCVLQDENIVSINPLLNPMIGGIKLQVNAADARRASAILDLVDIEPIRDDEGEIIRCPRCRSKYIINGFRTAKTWKATVVTFLAYLVGIYPPYTDNVYKCEDCDHEFNFDTLSKS